MTQLDKAKARLRLAQILFEETESVERCEDELNRAITTVDAIQGSMALDIQLRLYDLQIQLFIESKQFRLAKNTLKIALAEAANQPSFISIKWMSFSQVYCLTYLLSGICSKADMTQPMKAQLFLIEGIKVVDREFSVNDHASATINVRRNQRWFSLLMMSMLLHLADVFLLKLELISVEETLLKATYWSKVCGMWDVFKWRISLSIGMTMHLAGRLEKALDWYGLCLNHSERAQQDQEGFDAKTLAIINTALIYCGERYYDLGKVGDLASR
ncbi:hypothetical protein BGZ70_008344 [Mortierella alpina]|uniref:Uncharacterized protein n=1 Tax=Mortierella alpina TaxID=64518 RepID=A0A9P6J5Y8_MORAP|nr:hypothetical protein BGZ70_008344 [Mortierella alpina]